MIFITVVAALVAILAIAAAVEVARMRADARVKVAFWEAQKAYAEAGVETPEKLREP